MKTIINTPFSEYREEQVKVNIFDYFVQPSFFEQLCDAKPVMIYGSRGTGKTTLLKAMTLSESKNVEQYLYTQNYIGVYYRIDLNVSTAFIVKGQDRPIWERLYAYYLVLKLSHELVLQFIRAKEILDLLDEEKICSKYGMLLAKNNNIKELEQLEELIRDELRKIRGYINNVSYEQYPYIGDYATIICELPRDLVNALPIQQPVNKTVFYLIDEFEGLEKWQQELILSFVKYSDKYFSFKICLRPDGLKADQIRGGEYIKETDDIRTVDLNKIVLSNKNDYYKYAQDVCKKRVELFYYKNNLSYTGWDIVDLLENITPNDEFSKIFLKKEEMLNIEIKDLLEKENINDSAISKFFVDNPFDFYIFKLMSLKRKSNVEVLEVLNHVTKRDDKYQDAVGNYKIALLYYLCFKNHVEKKYAGFKTLVDLSGGTIRYLLELCNEIFENAVINSSFDYENPEKISVKIQTDTVYAVSNKRLDQISAIPQIGLNIRTFVKALGSIFNIFHRDEKISKFEPSHFSIKAQGVDEEDNVKIFLRECVMRGVLIKHANNKSKNWGLISNDEYIYILHPIYTPSFQISWRRKQKAEFDMDEIKTLISNNTEKINEIIKKYKKRYINEYDITPLEKMWNEEE